MVAETYADVGNTAQIFELKTALRDKTQGEKTITQYYNELMGLSQELDLFQDLDWKCSINSEKNKKMMDKERVFDFLYGLNKDLDEVRGRVLGFKPFPEIKEAFAEVQREESRKRVMLSKAEESNPPKPQQPESSMFTKRHYNQNGDSQTGRRNGRPWCDHCQRVGHTKDTCWEIHGKPHTHEAN